MHLNLVKEETETFSSLIQFNIYLNSVGGTLSLSIERKYLTINHV